MSKIELRHIWTTPNVDEFKNLNYYFINHSFFALINPSYFGVSCSKIRLVCFQDMVIEFDAPRLAEALKNAEMILEEEESTSTKKTDINGEGKSQGVNITTILCEAFSSKDPKVQKGLTACCILCTFGICACKSCA